MTRTGVRMHRRRRRLAATMTLALLAGVWAGPVGRIAGGGDQVGLAARSSYVVRQGDTLWSIAQRVAPGEDPRPLVDAITAANGVEARAIVPGQTLLVPTGS
jgi:nucleoid-associated protein YgaU